MRHTHRCVRLAEPQTRDGRDRRFWNEFPDERDAASPTVFGSPPHVKAEINFVEILMQRYRGTQNARSKKAEPNDADVSTIAKKVNLGSRRNAIDQ